MSGDKMSGDKMPLEKVSDQYEYKDSAAGAPSRHGAGAPSRHGAGAPSRHGAGAPSRHGAGAPSRHGAAAPPPSRGAVAAPARTGAAGAPPPGYGAPSGHTAPQLHYAQPQYTQPQYAPPPPQPQPQYAHGGSFSAYPQQQQQQQQQMHSSNVMYGMPPPPPAAASYGYQQAVGAPPPQMMTMQPMGQWTTGLFDCGEDPSNSVITCLLPCITFGQVVEVVDQGTTSCLLAGSVWVAVLFCFLAPCFVSCLWRTKLRAKYNLPQDEIGDICLHFWCEPCALCQEYRELNNRGLNPSLGWEYHRQQMQMQMGAPQPVYMQR